MGSSVWPSSGGVGWWRRHRTEILGGGREPGKKGLRGLGAKMANGYNPTRGRGRGQGGVWLWSGSKAIWRTRLRRRPAGFMVGGGGWGVADGLNYRGFNGPAGLSPQCLPEGLGCGIFPSSLSQWHQFQPCCASWPPLHTPLKPLCHHPKETDPLLPLRKPHRMW